MSIMDKLSGLANGKKASKNGKKTAIGAGIAGVVGFGLGMIFAPHSGKKTRYHIAEKTKQVKGKVDGMVQASKSKVQEKFCKSNDTDESCKCGCELNIDIAEDPCCCGEDKDVE